MSLYQVSSGDRILAADLNQFYSILKGVAASGESVSLIYNAAGALILQPSSDPAVGTQLYQLKNNAGTVKAAMTAGGGGLFSSQVLLAQSSTISSAGTTDLSTATGNYAQISGTTTITAFGTVQAGTPMILEFQGILTLTHNASSLILRSGVNATTAAGDIYGFVSEGSGNWRELWHLTGASVALPDSDPTLETNYHRFRYEPFGAAGGTAWGIITNVGTGTTVISNIGHGVTLNTSTTNPSSTSVRTAVGGSSFITDPLTISKIRRIEFVVEFANVFANANCYLYLTTESADTVPTATPRHLGIKNLNGTISFTTADGTTEQTTSITASFTAASLDRVVITFDGTTAKCYVNGTLAATHATNVPGAGVNGIVLRAFINNNSTINDRSMHLMVADALIANS